MDKLLNPTLDVAMILLTFSFILGLKRSDDFGVLFFMGGASLIVIWLFQ